jgi:hypothetical protein
MPGCHQRQERYQRQERERVFIDGYIVCVLGVICGQIYLDLMTLGRLTLW